MTTMTHHHPNYQPGKWTVRYVVAVVTLILFLAILQLLITGSL